MVEELVVVLVVVVVMVGMMVITVVSDCHTPAALPPRKNPVTQ